MAKHRRIFIEGIVKNYWRSKVAQIRKIGVLSAGGDAPGMNAAIRAVVRTALSHDMEVVGVRRGYTGLIERDCVPLTARSVGGIIQRGGTILESGRSQRFRTAEGIQAAVSCLHDMGIDALVVVGGDGTMRGASALQPHGIAVVGVPTTIDNDVYGTEMSVGVDTALNTALDAIDKIKDTASSHHRAFFIEVMGRDCGYLALMAAVAGGAEAMMIPEEPSSVEDLIAEMRRAHEFGKSHFIVVAAEGARPQASEVVAQLSAIPEQRYEVRLSILGHIQRGGSPTAFDRLLATRLGAAAVAQLAAGNSGMMVGMIGSKITTTSIAEVVSNKKPFDAPMWRLAQILAV
jgi:6-phosphofructokinase 1